MSDPQEGTEGTEGKEAEGGDDRFSEDYVLQPSSTPGLGYQSYPDVDPEAEAAAEALALTEEMATGDITIPDDYVMHSARPWMERLNRPGTRQLGPELIVMRVAKPPQMLHRWMKVMMTVAATKSKSPLAKRV